MENKIICTLTYYPSVAPKTTLEDKANLASFRQRLHRYAKKQGHAPLRYACIYDLENEGRKISMHHHIVINFLEIDVIKKIWRNGIAYLSTITDEQYKSLLRRQKSEQ